MSMTIDKVYHFLYTLFMNLDNTDEEFYSLSVRKRHLLERKEDRQLAKRLDVMDKLRQLREEIEKLEEEAGIRQTERVEKSCVKCDSRSRYGTRIYNLDKIHYLDGDRSNKLHSNIAIVCPRCEGHILLSPFTPKDIWELKMKGMSNAEIGRLLGLSRERVRKLSKHYQPEPIMADNVDIDWLIKEAQKIETIQKARGLLKRRTDKRTLKKRIIAKLNKLKAKEAQNER
jgi:predicted transcriptional regulator